MEELLIKSMSESNIELSFHEKIVLLALDDKGWFGASEHKIKFGLVAAILFELSQKGRIRFAGDDVVVVNAKSTDDVILDRVLNLVRASEKQRSLRAWIPRIVNTKLLLRKTILKQLIKKNIIAKEEYVLMKVFSQTKFPIVNIELKQRLREQIYNCILSGDSLSAEEAMILVVMNDCSMVRKNSGGSMPYDKLHKRIGEVILFKSIEPEALEVVRPLHIALSRAIMASNVTIHL